MEAETRQTITDLARDLTLGPALVRGVMHGAILIDIDGRLERAQMALAYPYRPEVGDVILVIGREDQFYVTGVLSGKGVTRFDFPGDVELMAGGTLRLASRAGVEVSGERISMRADRLDVAVTTFRQSVSSFYQRVTGTLRTVAGRQRTTVEKESTLHAGRIVRKAQEDVIIDGRQIKLG